MPGISTAERNAVLAAIFGGQTYTPPTSYKFAILTTNPSDDAGTGLVQASYTGYATVEKTNNQTTFTVPSAGANASDVLISWTQIPSGEGPVAMTGVAWYNQSDVYKGFKAVSRTFQSLDTPQVSAGDMTNTISSS